MIGCLLRLSRHFLANHWRPPAAAAPPPVGAICPLNRAAFLFCGLLRWLPLSVLGVAGVSVLKPSRMFPVPMESGCGNIWSGRSEMHPRSAEPVPSHTQSLWAGRAFPLTPRRGCSKMSGNYYKGNEVSCCIKYFIFGFNILFWVRSFIVLFIRSAPLSCALRLLSCPPANREGGRPRYC